MSQNFGETALHQVINSQPAHVDRVALQLVALGAALDIPDVSAELFYAVLCTAATSTAVTTIGVCMCVRIDSCLDICALFVYASGVERLLSLPLRARTTQKWRWR